MTLKDEKQRDGKNIHALGHVGVNCKGPGGCNCASGHACVLKVMWLHCSVCIKLVLLPIVTMIVLISLIIVCTP